MINDAARFREIVLADEALSRSPQTFGLPAGTVPPTAAALEAAYPQRRVTAPKEKNNHWEAMFNVFRGFHGHGYSGTPEATFHDHDCPGPLFDWHRFARETWDWWWWPFDYDAATPNAPVAARPYSLPTRDGNTPLKEYYWDTPPATPRGRVRTGVHGINGSPQTFELPQRSRIYAMANGELVAARFPAEGAATSLAFVLVRHEVFHQLDGRAPAPDAEPARVREPDQLQPAADVHVLAVHAPRAPARHELRARGAGEPGLAEPRARAQARVRARRRLPQPDARDHHPGRQVERSPARHRSGARPWPRAGRPTTPRSPRSSSACVTVRWRSRPSDANTMPLRILLGDYLAHAGGIGQNRLGVRVELFANDVVHWTDFNPVDTMNSSRGWTPPAAPGNPIIRYASEWSRTPVGAEELALRFNGVRTSRS